MRRAEYAGREGSGQVMVLLSGERWMDVRV